jgi:CheY-like chemotaxis protein
MIIEDESIIALHIRSIVEGLGHGVAGIARTRQEAVDMARRVQPELVLADISLADGSSGIDAVKDILSVMDVPVIFITAFPERLLTGERPEPTYLITKPFEPETVTATIGQALLVHRELHASPAEVAA